jgi:hypothetical protein
MKYYPAKKGQNPETYRQVNSPGNLVSSRSQTQKSSCCVIPFIWSSREGRANWSQWATLSEGVALPELSGVLEMFSDLMWVVITRVKVYVNKSSSCTLRWVYSMLLCNRKVQWKKNTYKRASEILISSFKPHCSFFSKNERGPDGLRFLQNPKGL